MNQRKKKKWVKICSFLIGMVILLGVFFFHQKQKVENQNKQNIAKYQALLEKQAYDSWLELFSDESFKEQHTSKKEVSTRYQKIFQGIGATHIKLINIKMEKDKNRKELLTYNLKVKTQYGEFTTNKYRVNLPKTLQEKMNWHSSLIFPNMAMKDTVNIKVSPVSRGEIIDRNGEKLAENFEYQQLGVNPSKFKNEEDKQQVIANLSEKFGLSTVYIQEQLAKPWAKGNVFVPLKTLENSLSQLNIMALPDAVVIGSVTKRYYPLKEAAAHLIGYVGKVTKEDMDQNNQLTEEDYVGRAGLEYTFDKELRGRPGVTISIVTQEKKLKKQLLSVKEIEPKNIALTIDKKAQKIAYEALNNKPGTTIVSDSKRGDILVASSSPSYNPNKMVVGISSEEYQTYAENPDHPFTARFSSRYAPGSTFKTITAAIGLDTGVITENEQREISGLKWQKDGSWGGFWTTRVKNTPVVDLRKALVYSDNIYFAQKGLEIGEENFRRGLAKFIFGEQLALPISITPATISNSDKFPSEILFADTAYGQGQLMIAPITQLTMYSIFLNDGALVYPQLIKDSTIKVKEGVTSSRSANIVLNDLIGSVEQPDGYVRSLYNPEFVLAAKTGTAEIKKKQDEAGFENSFLLFFDAKNRRFMGLTMVENSDKYGSATAISKELVAYLENQ